MVYDAITMRKATLIIDTKAVLQEREILYAFTSLAQLLADFARDVERLSGEIK